MIEDSLKAIDRAGKKIRRSKKEARRFLVMAGIMDEKGSITRRYRRSYVGEPKMKPKKATKKTPYDGMYSGYTEDHIAMMKAMKEIGRKARRSKETAHKFLMECGYIDKDGNLTKRYR